MSNEQMTNDEVYLAALAGLLHDVGKFAQRADWQRGKHTDVGGEFVRQYVPEQWREHLYPVMGHHDHPLQGHETKVVALADRLSAAEREEVDESGERQLISIFTQIGKEEQRPGKQFWPLEPLTLSDGALFPGAALPTDDETKAYGALWDGFVETVQALPSNDLPTYLEGLYYALQRFTWCVPGAYYRALPDVSLFDHSRTTAALAVCLAGLDEPALDGLLIGGPRRDKPLVLLVGGDLSGVQDFIYTITARGAAKGLRGRSFYLQLLTEAVARFILRELGLPITNLLYAGGGHFHLLAPLSAEEKLRGIRADVSRKLLAHHGGDLYLALGWTKASADDFNRERFGEKWREVTQAMNKAKRHRFAELDDADLLVKEVFGPLGRGGDKEGECQVCHFDGPVEIEHAGDEEHERRICQLCKSLENLGADLREADYLLLGEVEPEDTERAGYAEALAAFGLAVGFTKADGMPVLYLPDDVRRATLLAMRDWPDVAGMAGRVSRKRGYAVAPGIRYTVNVTPRVSSSDLETPEFERCIKGLESWEIPKQGDVKEFDLMQEQSQGVKRLGVLRMDVDDLGDLFRWGMQEATTLSRVVSLSFALSLFFEGWVGELCRRINDAGTDKVYAIYSGGDDLFVVGAWDALPGLAAAIRRDLNRFAAGNCAVHISGGLTLHAGKYPLYQAAVDAEAALGTAKDLVREDGHTKDAFNFLGLTIPWERFSVLEGEKEQLVKLVKPTNEGGLGVSQALLRTLLRLYARFTDAVQERGKPYWGPWMWQGAYFLKRMEGRYKAKEEAQAEIKRIRESLKQDDFRYIETLGPAARWAELSTRKEQEQ